jgi:UDP-glucuronate decarboxylase
VLNDFDGLRNVITLSKNVNVKHVYFSSSLEVYVKPVEIPQNEYSTPLNSNMLCAFVSCGRLLKTT